MAPWLGGAISDHTCPGEDEDLQPSRGPSQDGRLCGSFWHILDNTSCYGFGVCCRVVILEKSVWKSEGGRVNVYLPTVWFPIWIFIVILLCSTTYTGWSIHKAKFWVVHQNKLFCMYIVYVPESLKCNKLNEKKIGIRFFYSSFCSEFLKRMHCKTFLPFFKKELSKNDTIVLFLLSFYDWTTHRTFFHGINFFVTQQRGFIWLKLNAQDKYLNLSFFNRKFCKFVNLLKRQQILNISTANNVVPFCLPFFFSRKVCTWVTLLFFGNLPRKSHSHSF